MKTFCGFRLTHHRNYQLSLIVRGTEGPLSVALLKRQQMEKYCTIPLVLDFMGRKFSKGLPSIMDREGVLENFDNIEDPSRLLGWCWFYSA